MTAAGNHKAVPKETFPEVEECNDSKETVTHQDSQSASEAPYYHDKQWAEMNRTRKKNSSEDKKYDPGFEMPEDEISPGTQVNEHVQQAEKPSETTSPGTQVNEHVQQAEKPSETTSCEHVHVEKPSQNTRMKTLLQLVKKKQPRIKQLLQEICRIDGIFMRFVLPELVEGLSELLKDLEREFVPIKHEIEATAAVHEALGPADRNQLRSIIRSYSAVSFENLISIKSDEKGELKYTSKIMKLNEATTKFGESCIERVKCVCGK